MSTQKLSLYTNLTMKKIIKQRQCKNKKISKKKIYIKENIARGWSDWNNHITINSM